MFTGLVEEVGTVAAVEPNGNGLAITIAAASVLAELALGDSIAVDGVCQTVVEHGGGGFTVQAIATTLGRTTLGRVAPGQRVNLERALRVGERLGGHLVQGHVDGVGEVLSVERLGELVLIDVSLPPIVADVTILHGSITFNGISLTVNALPRPGVAQVSIIPHTWNHTNLPALRVGTGVNLEGDTIGKYVRHLLQGPLAASADLRRAWGYKEAEG